MIRTKKKRTDINGSILTVTKDFVTVVIAVKDFLSERMPEDVASRCVVSCVKIAYNVDDEEKMNMLCEELMSRLEEGFERRNEVMTS